MTISTPLHALPWRRPITTPLQPLYVLTFTPRGEHPQILVKDKFYVVFEQQELHFMVVRLKDPVDWVLLPNDPADYRFELVRMQTPITRFWGRIIGPGEEDKIAEQIRYGTCNDCMLYLYT